MHARMWNQKRYKLQCAYYSGFFSHKSNGCLEQTQLQMIEDILKKRNWTEGNTIGGYQVWVHITGLLGSNLEFAFSADACLVGFLHVLWVHKALQQHAFTIQ